MNIILLTHEREVSKKTNTGVLVSDVLGENARVVVWERKNPDPELLAQIENGKVALLYPTEYSEVVSAETDFDSYIVLDGTWQEAQKIYNKSAYLKDLPKVKIETSTKSIYQLRRNQKPNGLCTAECVIELLKAKGIVSTAEELQSEFEAFVAVN
ncbi:DTW domain-containing protein [Shewanella sp. 202IG2-18]|uniref:tRNA-uridine aminocarboxypropyltransferase n=1 Tax=Parashewanella hymeniacidonis TaxID=2807618 RepID=UPI001960D037|nr:tRNA-uridine aminocarboxypropyltransferase [Parashewanella hymeniacidonis]MBM7072648.1 DTW domain-containing protein [Parashewanella hymeniacidonis]